MFGPCIGAVFSSKLSSNASAVYEYPAYLAIILSIINILDTQFNNNFNTIYFFSQEINFVILILIVLITSCYSIYYYLKIVKIIFFENKQNKTPPVFNINSNIVAYTFLGFIFIFNFTGIFFFN